MTQSSNFFMLQLKQLKFQYCFAVVLARMSTKGIFPPAAEAVGALSTQTGDRTKTGVKACTMTTLLHNNLNQSLL